MHILWNDLKENCPGETWVGHFTLLSLWGHQHFFLIHTSPHGVCKYNHESFHSAIQILFTSVPGSEAPNVITQWLWGRKEHRDGSRDRALASSVHKGNTICVPETKIACLSPNCLVSQIWCRDGNIYFRNFRWYFLDERCRKINYPFETAVCVFAIKPGKSDCQITKPTYNTTSQDKITVMLQPK